jgi:hypothetical protein
MVLTMEPPPLHGHCCLSDDHEAQSTTTTAWTARASLGG